MAARLRVDLAYDGTPFHGFAKQRGLPTVQGVLEEQLSRVLDQPVVTTGAGRTDKGVHADHQVVHLDVDTSVAAAGRALADLAGTGRRLDLLVGPAIAIVRVRRVPETFDARFGATERRYRYRIVDGPVLHPLRRFDVWHLGEPLAIAPMRRAGRELIGEHDFSSFCRRAGDKTLVRRLDAVTVARRGDEVVVRLRGLSFCHQQVRSIVGCLVEVGSGRQAPAWLGDVLAARDRTAAARVAPPHGLTLEAVRYGAPPPARRLPPEAAHR